MSKEDAFTDSNPYASPLAGPLENRAAEALPDEGEGLPWERDGIRWSTFWQTLKLILFSPTECFQLMFREGRLGAAVLFLVLCSLVVACCAATLQSAVQLWVFSSMAATGAVGGRNALVAGGVFAAVGNFFVAITSSLVCVPFGVLGLSAAYHGTLLLVGGARARFETTLRVCLYAFGGTQLLILVPVVCLTQPIWQAAVLILGLASAHQTSGGKAAVAVLLPLVLCCAAYLSLVALAAYLVSA